MTILAIDQGTTSTRALLFDAQGRRATVATREHRQIYPATGWVEHDPDELLTHVAACIDAGRTRGARAVGLANQGESCLAWDAGTGAAVSPVIVWQDARTEDAVRALADGGAQAEVLARAGLPLDSYFSAPKLGWILRGEPEAARLHARGRLRLGTTDAFFRDRLTGRFETDIATASRTSLLNLETGQWDPVLCDLFGVPIEALPRITPCTGDLGTAGGLPLTASLVDQQAALYGHGCRAPGDAKITFGTGAFALALTGPDLIRPAGGPLPTIAWQLAGQPPWYALDGGVYAASAAVNWARDLGLFDNLAEIDAFDHPSALARGIAFVPALAGLACPHWDRGARGAWFGLTLETGRKDLVQALLEGVAYRIDEVLRAMTDQIALADPISVDGGMSANPWFCRLVATVGGRDLLISDEAELTAVGVALLAAAAAGHPIDVARRGRRVTPDPDMPTFRARFAKARACAQAFGDGTA